MRWDRQTALMGSLTMVILLIPPCGSGALHAQEPDSAEVYEVDPVVVTAGRSSARLVTSTAAVSRISGEDLRALPLRSLADALRMVPGMTVVDTDGLGYDPRLMLRGFYGGGEAEYVVVLLDGRPLNALQTGLHNWELVPLSAIESIEVVRGGASSLYGDAAVGGVINLVTDGSADAGVRASLYAGGRGLVQGALAMDTELIDRPLALFGSYRRMEGFRDHAERASASATGSVALLSAERGRLSLATLHHWRGFEQPGPLSSPELDRSRTGISPFYRFDRTEERLHRLALDGGHELGDVAELTGYLVGEYRAQDQVRTLPLSPEFADTQNRLLTTTRLLGSAQILLGSSGSRFPGQVLVGLDGSWGEADNKYFAVATGDADAYRASDGARGALNAHGEGGRLTTGLFARYGLLAVERVRLTAGVRLDWLRDVWTPLSPSEGERMASTHFAYSPRAGVNVRYLRTPRHEGHVFASIGRSFKAPTPDQLFDQRSIPVPFEPYQVTISNAALQPQYGTSVEIGLYHAATLIRGSLTGRLSLTAYQMDMRDELDVDLEMFRYVNIGRSRHRGIEAGLELEGPAGIGGHASYTVQAVTFQRGEHEGNQLKAIPRHALNAGLRARHASGLTAALSTQSGWGIHLDDANSIELPGYTRLDARLSYAVAGVRLTAEMFNVLDREYSSTGFPDPAGTGTIYYFPAAGRTLRIGLSTGQL